MLGFGAIREEQIDNGIRLLAEALARAAKHDPKGH